MFFDLARIPESAPINTDIGKFLQREECNPLNIFQKLCSWKRSGFLRDSQLILRKLETDDLLLYDHLSDGEREFLGRICLFYLLNADDTLGTGGAFNTLVLLDEPETHFNDVWKRELVSIISDVMDDRPNHFLISTHSSIALTDVFEDEIKVLSKGEMGIKMAPPVSGRTFGATPDQTMREVFGCNETVGSRASRFINIAMKVADCEDELCSLWKAKTGSRMRDTPAFGALLERLQLELKQEVQPDQLERTLHGLRALEQALPASNEPLGIRALRALESRLGPGYLEFEVLRKIHVMTQGA